MIYLLVVLEAKILINPKKCNCSTSYQPVPLRQND